jgi:capsular polysaccharide biosynthesis protein
MAFRSPGGHRDRQRKVALLAALLAASERLYGALLVVYPKAFRRRYASEMLRDFGDLSREGLEEGGGRELARVWAATLTDLAVTALKERGTTLARDAYVLVAPRIAAGLTLAVVVIAVTATVASLARTPQYEASVQILVGQARGTTETPNDAIGPQLLTQTMAEGVSSRPVARAVISQEGLQMTTEEFLEERLSVEQIDGTQFIRVDYKDASPERAQRVANAVGNVFSEQVSEVSPSANTTTATVWNRAGLPEEPVSPKPLRNGLLALVLGLMLIAGLALAVPSGAASGVGDSARRMTRPVDRAARWAQWTPPRTPVTQAAKEKELLEALRRRGRLTVAGVALETSLTVAEADRMLSELAAAGHLEVRVEHGRLLYALGEGDAPL